VCDSGVLSEGGEGAAPAAELLRDRAKNAWRRWQGARPGRVRTRPPPVSSLASMAASEGRPRRTRGATRRPSVLEAGGVTAHPAGLVPLRQKRVADAAGCHAHRRPHTSRRVGEAAKVRRRPQAAAGRKRDDKARGRPPRRRAGGPDGSRVHSSEGTAGESRPQDAAGPSPTGGHWAPGRRRRTVTGQARRMRRGRLITQRTPRVGKPRTRGRAGRQDAARTGPVRRTRAEQTHASPPPGGAEPTRRQPTRRPAVETAPAACTSSADGRVGAT
jgi:hypothetical protein